MRNAISLACLLLAALPSVQAGQQASNTFSLGSALAELPRYGLNLGGSTVWGADQLMANVLRNPGLEAIHDGALVVVAQSDGTSVVDDTPWTARAAGFWGGAQFTVLSGAATGQTGRVVDDRPVKPGGATQLWLNPMPQGVGPGDVVALEGQQDPAAVPLWWTRGHVRNDTAQRRPNSPGQQSVRLVALPRQDAALIHHLDGITPRAGKLLPVEGAWRLSFWVKGESRSARMRIHFARQGSRPWVDQPLSPKPEWQQVVIEFEAHDNGPVGPLALTLQVEAGEVLIDDVELGERLPGAGGFRQTVVDTLTALRPGYLRDWQGQLADTPANRGAEAFARHPVRYRPGEHEAHFMYSTSAFLALCASVGARPWVILPATSTPTQAKEFGRQLAQAWARHHFDEIVVEYGNEHWNSLFRPAGVASAKTLGPMADRLYAALREGAGPSVPLHWVLGAQYVNPNNTRDLLDHSRSTRGIAVAPYFLYRVEASQTPQQALDMALGEDVNPLVHASALTRARGRSLDVYEVNFHTTLGSASGATRNAVLDSPAAGVALARRLMQASVTGVTRQAVYTLAGYDSYTSGANRELAHLWGIARDLTRPRQWRPTGLALEMLNNVTGGRAFAGACQGQACTELTALSFQNGMNWAFASSSAQAQLVEWPCLSGHRMVITLLDGQTLQPLGAPEKPAHASQAELVCRADRGRWLIPARSLLTVKTR